MEDYPNQEAIEDHFMINIHTAWAKLNEYYLKLDDTPVSQIPYKPPPPTNRHPAHHVVTDWLFNYYSTTLPI